MTNITTLSDEQIDEEWFDVYALKINYVAKARVFARAVLALADEQHKAEIAALKDRISFMGDELAIEVNWRNKACDASDDALMRLIAALAELDALRISDRIKTENCEALRADAFTAAIDAARSKA